MKDILWFEKNCLFSSTNYNPLETLIGIDPSRKSYVSHFNSTDHKEGESCSTHGRKGTITILHVDVVDNFIHNLPNLQPFLSLQQDLNSIL
jgi:hypothetical protein